MPISVAVLASAVIQTYFNKFLCIYYFGDSYVNTNNIPVIKTSLNFSIEEDIFQVFKCEGFVIFTSEPTRDVELIESAIHLNPVYSFNLRYYLLIYDNDNDDILNTSSVFNRTVFGTLVNVLLLVERNHCVEMYTHQYSGFAPLNTHSLGKLCDLYDISTLDLYPDKQNNLMGRQLTIATFKFIPYVYLDKNRGAELSLINTFIDKYNYTPHLLVGDRWGRVFDNLSGIGSVFDVFSGKADIGVAGFYLSEFDYKLDKSTHSLRIGLSYLVPRAQVANGLTILSRPFHYVVWLWLLGTFVVLVITMHITHRLNTSTIHRFYNGTNLTLQFVFIVLRYLLQQPVTPRRKILGVIVIKLGMILLATFYSSGYASLMTKPAFLKHISTGKDLEKSSLPYLVHDESYLNNVDESIYPNIKENAIIVDSDELNTYLRRSTNVAIAIDHLELGYAFGDFDPIINISILETFTVLHEDISFDWCGFPVYKHSVILPILNEFITHARETGLDYYFLAESFRDMNQQKYAYLMNRLNRHARATRFFNVKSLSGAFTMLFIGLLMATFSFLWEIKNKPQFGW